MGQLEKLVLFWRCEFCGGVWQSSAKFDHRRPDQCRFCQRRGWYDGKTPPYKKMGPKVAKAKVARSRVYVGEQAKLSGSEVLRRLRAEIKNVIVRNLGPVR